MSTSPTLRTLLDELAGTLEPLRTALTDPGVFHRWMWRLGWDVGPPPASYRVVADRASAFIDAVRALDDEPAPVELATLSGEAAGLIRAIHDLAEAPTGVDAAAFLPEAPRRLIEQLCVEHVARRHPALYAGLQALGAIREEFIPAAGGRPGHLRTTLDLGRMATSLADPTTLPEAVYGWGTDALDVARLLTDLSGLLGALGFLVVHGTVGRELARGLQGPARTEPMRRLMEVWLHEGLGSGRDALTGLVVTDLPPSRAGEPPGIAILPSPAAGADEVLPLGDGWTLELRAGMDLEDAFGILIRPGGVEVRFPFAPGATLPDGHARAALVFGPDAPAVLLGTAGGTRLELGGASAEAAIVTEDDALDLQLAAAVDDLALVVAPGAGDGFLAPLLGTDEIRVSAPLRLSWSMRDGVVVQGGVAGEWTARLNEEIGPLHVRSLTLGLATRGGGDTDLVAAISGGLKLGPVGASVDRIGMRISLRPGEPGVLGNADLTVDFQPPTGVGLSLGAEGIRVAGFLSLDLENGRYTGAVDICVMDRFDLTGIGLLTTRMPDGSEGFSLLVMIDAEFPSPIHLAYNFHLAGVGGLLGIQRGVDLDRLRDGVYAGTLDRVLFPSDAVANIDAIVSDLREIFPPRQGQVVFSPMALITWNTPPLIRAELALLIELPDPVRVAILGTLRAAIPSEDSAIVDIRASFLGAIDFGRGTLGFDARIHDSFIGYGWLKFTLSGDIALRLGWGGRPDFVVTVGGFHPAYRPPAHLGLGEVQRTTLSLLKDNPRLTLTSYLAITTNSIQFGAQIDFYFKVWKFSVVGLFGFDALFQISPFRFAVDVRAHLAVRCGSADILSLTLAFSLEGTSPWIAAGKASFSLLFFDVSVRFRKVFGERAEVTLPDVAVLPRLLEVLEQDDAWQAGASAIAPLIVPRRRGADDAAVAVDPGGSLTVRQGVVPLVTELTRFGAGRPTDIRRASVSALRVGDREAETTTEEDLFAPSSYQDLADRARLEAPAYEPRPSGVTARGSRGIHTDGALVRAVEYESEYSDEGPSAPPRVTTERPRVVYQPPRTTFEALASGGAVSRSNAARMDRVRRDSGTVMDAQVARESWVVALTADLSVPDDRCRGLSRDEAHARRRELIARGARPAALTVVPEVRAAS